MKTPEAAKERYLAQIDDLVPAPAAIVDSGNGLNLLLKLKDRIVLPKPERAGRGGKQVLDYDDATKAQIAAIEVGAKRLMEQLGSVAGTQNIDRILRLPGTINLPTRTKLIARTQALSGNADQVHRHDLRTGGFPRSAATATKDRGSKDRVAAAADRHACRHR